MSIHTTDTQPLALLGGQPLFPDRLSAPAWPPVDDETADALREVYLSRAWSFNGPHESAFCREFAEYHGARHGVFMANGTVTLFCALKAHGVGAGDEVIVPALTWMATALAVHYTGATPIFVDVEPSTLCLDVAKTKAALTAKTRAIIPVHIFGGMADMDALTALASERNLVLIEDCAHGHGGKWAGRGVGSWGHVGSFSFQQSKTMASGEGGICLTNDDGLADRLHRLKHIGYNEGAGQGQARTGPPEGLVCHNFRATDFQAVILRHQLKHLPELIDRYNRTADVLTTRLQAIEGVRVQSRGLRAGPQSYYGFVVLIEDGPLSRVPRESLFQALNAEGLSVGGSYGPVYRHTLFNLSPQQYRIHEGSCPVAETLATEQAVVLSHTWLGADEQTIDGIAGVFEKVAGHAEALRGRHR